MKNGGTGESFIEGLKWLVTSQDNFKVSPLEGMSGDHVKAAIEIGK